ncbi:MAPEG family protein [Alphaproteobacteria bacterium]|jgi:hypothetical protein|nr:MAPEG family protein [Alphaproteobacteria bacterium]
MEPTAILQPVIVLGLWTVVVFVWMMATRAPAMQKAGIKIQDAKHPRQMKLPSQVIQVSDNYNHLFEQPTLFYAIAISIAVLGHGDALNVQLAWAFVLLRIIHSVVQGTINIVAVRFSLFALAWVVLAAMVIRETLRIF